MKEMKDVLKDLREEKNLSQMQLATKLNLSVSAIGMYESGKRIPRPEILEAFADFLQCRYGLSIWTYYG